MTRYRKRALAAFTLAHVLWATPILALGKLVITRNDASESAPTSVGRSTITTSGRAVYEGEIGDDLGRDASIGSGVRESNESFYSHNGMGNGKDAKLTATGQILNCPTSCGGSLTIDVCQEGTYIPTRYDHKTEVAIVRPGIGGSNNFTDKTEVLNVSSNHCDPPEEPPADEEDNEGTGSGGVGSGNSPLVVHLSARGVGWCKKSFGSSQQGVPCDLDGDGQIDQCGWVKPGSSVAFLIALTFDENAFLAAGGVLMPGPRNLFGNHSPQDESSSPNGFEALRWRCDQHLSADGLSADLWGCGVLLWHDLNNDGLMVVEEIAQPVDHDIQWMPVAGYQTVGIFDQHGNTCRYKTTYAPGRHVIDVFFQTIPAG